MHSKKFLYTTGGVGVRATFPVAGLHALPDSGIGGIDITLGSVGLPAFLSEARTELFRWPGRYGLQLFSMDGGWLFSTREHGSFAVTSGGDAVHCIPAGVFGSIDPESLDVPPDGLCQVLMRRILPRVLHLHGRLSLHGATMVTEEGKAFLLLGASGAGKSTLSLALHHHLQWHVFSDDISILDPVFPPRCFPVVRGACVWPDSLASLESDDLSAHPLPGHDGKLWQQLDLESAGLAAPLAGIIFLDNTEQAPHDVRLEPIPPVQGLSLAMRQLVRFNPGDHSALPGLMHATSRVCDAVPAFLFSYPRRYDMLAEVAGRLRQELAAHV